MLRRIAGNVPQVGEDTSGVLYAVLGLVGRLFFLEVHKAARVLPVFKDMYNSVGRPLTLIAGVIAAGASRPAVFQRPRHGDFLLREHTGDLGRPVPRKAEAVYLLDYGGGCLYSGICFFMSRQNGFLQYVLSFQTGVRKIHKSVVQ